MYNNNKLCQIHVHLFWKKLSPQVFSMSLGWAIHLAQFAYTPLRVRLRLIYQMSIVSHHISARPNYFSYSLHNNCIALYGCCAIIVLCVYFYLP